MDSESLSWLYDFDKVLLGVAGSWRKYRLPVALHKKQSDVDGWQKKHIQLQPLIENTNPVDYHFITSGM